ncbi:MAG: ABC transporter permease [Armatimonadota bacterium]
MNFLICLKIALINLSRNKFRSVLTLIGIIMGIASVTAIYTIGVGFNNMIEKEFKALGADSIIILPFKLEFGKSSARGVKFTPITMKDMDAIKKECDEVSTIVPKLSAYNRKVSFKNKFIESSVTGTTPDFFAIDNKELEQGSYFGMLDVRKLNKVCVLGNDVAKELFSSGSAVGKKIRIGKEVFEVIGVLKKYPKGKIYFGQLDKEVVMPYTTMDAAFSERREARVFDARVVIYKKYNVNAVKDKINGLLRQRKNIPEDQEESFTVTTAEQFTQALKKMVGGFIAFLSVVTFISLLIGGIGIMNIMLVSVTERTKEIGIRMAVGAKSKDIILQFLTEAVVLCFIGGVIGVILSIPASLAITKGMGWPTKISWWVVMLAFIYSAGIGVIFGYYPAKNAAELDPIESLRYE